MKDNWTATIFIVLSLYLFLFYAQERYEDGYSHGLCVAGAGFEDDALERCMDLYP